MRLQKFVISPVDQGPFEMDQLNKTLKGAVHVETYTKDEERFGGDRTIVIFAFYPDEVDEKEVIGG